MTLLIDASFIFYKNLFFVAKDKGDKILFQNPADDEEFISAVSHDVSNIIRQFEPVDRVVWIRDSQSWRKDVFIKDGGYKKSRETNRDKQEFVHWPSFWKLMDEFADVLRRKNVIISKVDKAEGDDLLYIWGQHMKEVKDDCILVTSDSDIYQSVEIKGDNICLVYNNNSRYKKLVAPTGFNDWLQKEEENTLMSFSFNSVRDILKRVIKEEKLSVVEVDPNKYIFEKILLGDDGDDVPAVWNWIKANGRTDRITPAKSKQIMEVFSHISDFNVVDLLEDDTYHRLIYNKICEISKTSPDYEEVKDCIIRNTRLILLHENIIPTEIQTDFKSNLSMSRVNSFTRNSLLEGTRFHNAGGDTKSFNFNFFKDWQ